jgi:hypothetical protein
MTAMQAISTSVAYAGLTSSFPCGLTRLVVKETVGCCTTTSAAAEAGCRTAPPEGLDSRAVSTPCSGAANSINVKFCQPNAPSGQYTPPGSTCSIVKHAPAHNQPPASA